MTSKKSGAQTAQSDKGNPRAALSRIKNHLRSAVPEPAVLHLIGRESKQKGTSKLTSTRIERIIKASRKSKPLGSR